VVNRVLLSDADHDAESAEDPGESGASAVEYAVLIALIAAVLIAIVITVGLQVFGTFDCMTQAFQLFPNSTPPCLP
jgi:Flp pilus assembly pilin Flp